MLTVLPEKLDGSSTKVRVHWHSAPVSLGSAVELCHTDEVFRTQLIDALVASPYTAYFWEMPPVTASSLGRPFEFVLTEAPGLARAAPEINAFLEHFDSDDDRDGVVAFENLGRDATLVVPCPLASVHVYAHFAAFLRGAPQSQTHALLRCVAKEILARVSDRPFWVSTAGMGVFWLHIRLDRRPKYYRHTPYKLASSA